ncbi:MAG: hypothetical protein ABSH07_10920 [Candidatus Dormibacteria bacterium]|jgi:hypothetical protein
MEHRKSKRSLRVALVLGTAVAGTALVGWGGLAAWAAYTENAGNSVAAGTLAHSNGSSCVSSLGVIPTSGTGFCSATITVSNVDPATWTGTTGTIKIANTGSLSSTFQLSMGTALQAPTGSLCADVTLAVTDLNTGSPDNGTVWTATALTGTFTAKSLYTNGSTPSTTWPGGGTVGAGTGTSADTYTVTVAPGGGFAGDYADQGTSCTFGLLFTQTAA